MLRKIINKISRNQKGITGLETAIILIAFVVVASVFAYTVLSAGIFSSQKGKEAIYSGLDEARAAVEPKGSMLAYKGEVGVTETAVKIAFTVTNALEGQAIDLTPPYVVDGGGDLADSTYDNVCLVTYIDNKQLINDVAWTINFIGKNNGDYLLESGEQAVITVWMVNYTTAGGYALGAGVADPFIDAEANLLGTYDTFTIEMKGEKGAALIQERSLPPRLDTVMDLR